MAATDSDQGFEDFVAATQDLFAAMRRNRGRLARSESGLSLSQLSLLDAVATRGPLLVGEIAAYAGVSGPSATRMLKQLEGDGVVTRRRSADDERKVMVDLTSHGRDLVERQRRALRQAQRQQYLLLSPEQRAVFVDVLQQMAGMIGEWNSELR